MFAAMPLAAAVSVAAVASPHIITLDDALRSARAHQPQLTQARALAEAAWARSTQARSPLLPQLTAAASYQRTTANFALRPGAVPASITTTAAPTFDTFNYFSVGATLTQYLWDFGATPMRWSAARASAEAQGKTTQAISATVELGVRTAYFAARAARDLVDVARDTLANQDKHLTQIKGFVDVGVRPMIDLVQARTNRATASAQLITAQANYATAKAQLVYAVGLDSDTDFDVAAEGMQPIDGEEQRTDDLLVEASKSRPDLMALEAQLEAQRKTITSLKGNYGPAVNGAVSFSDAGTDPTRLTWNWVASINASWSIFSGGLTWAQVREAEANLMALTAQRDQLRQQLRLDVDQARLAVAAAKASLIATTEALDNAREQLHLAEQRYTTGLGNVIELSDAQVAVTNAWAQKTQSELNLALARSQLVRALGRV